MSNSNNNLSSYVNRARKSRKQGKNHGVNRTNHAKLSKNRRQSEKKGTGVRPSRSLHPIRGMPKTVVIIM